MLYCLAIAIGGLISNRSVYWNLFWVPAALFTLIASLVLIGPFAYFQLSGLAGQYANEGIQMPDANIAMILFAVVARYSALPLLLIWAGLALGRPHIYLSQYSGLSLLNFFLVCAISFLMALVHIRKKETTELEDWHKHPKLVKIEQWPPKTDDEKATYAWMQSYTKNGARLAPVEFYAIALDENNRPLPGIVFNYKLDAEKEDSVTSGADGRIFILRPSGRQMSIHPQENGYWLQKTTIKTGIDSYFTFSECLDRDFYPSNPHEPVIYRFRRELPPERYYIWWDGRTIAEGEKCFIKTLKFHPSDNFIDPAIWLSAIISEKGLELTAGSDQDGLVSGEGVLDPLAPESGYQPKLTILEPNGHFDDLTFYFITPDHRYGCVTLRPPLIKNDRRIMVEYHVVFNPSGSRNLRTYKNPLRINNY